MVVATVIFSAVTLVVSKVVAAIVTTGDVSASAKRNTKDADATPIADMN